MQSSRADFLTYPFSMSDSDATKIYQLLTELFGKVEISTKCADSINRKFDTLDELLKYENVKSKRIVQLDFSARSNDHAKRADLHFTAHTSPFLFFYAKPSLYLSLIGEERTIIEASERIEDRLEEMKPWYSFFTKINFAYLTPIVLGTFVLTIFILVSFGFLVTKSLPDPSNESKLSDLATFYYYLFVFALICLSYWLNKFWTYLFPIGTFRIGQGIRREQHLDIWRIGVFLSLFVSIIGGVILMPFQNAP